MTINNLFISADVGARSGFVGAWLNKKLKVDCFDVGEEIGVFFQKSHIDKDNLEAGAFPGLKIRIRPDLEMLHIHMKLSLLKDVYPKIPNFKYEEQSYEVFEKMYYSAKIWFNHDQQIDLKIYDKVINFSDTYNLDKMIDLYRWYNHDEVPSSFEIEAFHSTNKKNCPDLDLNDSCVIAALIFKKEKDLGLNEIERYWSAEYEFKNPDRSSLYQRINEKISKDNYGRSELFSVGFNQDSDILWKQVKNL